MLRDRNALSSQRGTGAFSLTRRSSQNPFRLANHAAFHDMAPVPFPQPRMPKGDRSHLVEMPLMPKPVSSCKPCGLPPRGSSPLPLLLAITAFLAVCGVDARTSTAADIAWLTGEPLKAHLEDKLGATWSEAPLRAALIDLGKTQKIAILLDRRVDPGQPLDLTLKDAPLQQALEQIAAKVKLGTAWVGGVAYFGPSATAQRLRTVAALRREEISKLPLAIRPKFIRTRAWKWDDLATPRELLAELGKEAGVTFAGGDAIPHDLWAGGDWPAMPWCERMTLILGQYDLTFEIAPGGEQATFMRLPDKPVLAKTYPGPANVGEIATKLRRLLPAARIEVASGKLSVEATAEDHDLVVDLLSGKSVKKTTTAEVTKIDKLAVQNIPVGKLLPALGQKLGLEVRLDEAAIQAAGISLEKLVSVNVQNATLDDVFKAATANTGLSYRIREKKVEIFPVEKR